MINPSIEPEILEAQWDRQQVAALFHDLQQGDLQHRVVIQHVQVRSSLGDRSMPLAEAQTLFAQGDAKAIQIRYQFDGQLWCDTLMVEPETTKVIRTQLPDA